MAVCLKCQILFFVLGRSDKASILSGLIKKTNALEMKWLLMIILKGYIILFIAFLCLPYVFHDAYAILAFLLIFGVLHRFEIGDK